jgi:dihydrofolate reductase
MARFVYGLNQSLDGYVDHDAFAPGPILFRHFIDQVRSAAGLLYGRRIYELMRYWEEDQPGWGADERDFAAAWRGRHKWVVSRTVDAVGPNATLVRGDLAAAAGRLKAELEGDVDVAGPELAASLGDLGLIDEYRPYIHPVVLGGGRPFFAGRRPFLRLAASEMMGEGVIRLTYVPA